MCGRFARKSTQEVLADWFGHRVEEIPWFAPSYNVAPQSVQPAVRLNRDSGRREVALLRWSLAPFWILLANSICRLPSYNFSIPKTIIYRARKRESCIVTLEP